MADDARGPARRESGTEPVSGCLVRLGWLVGGVVMLLVLTITISQEPPWTLTAKDVAFWAVVGIVVALRYIDVKRFRGRTMEGEPATVRHVVRYAIGLVGASALLWTLAQSVQVPV